MLLLRRVFFLLALFVLAFTAASLGVWAQAPAPVIATVGIVAGAGPYPSGTPPHNSTVQSVVGASNYLGWTSYNKDGTTRYTYGNDKPCVGSAVPADSKFSGSYVATGNVFVSPSVTTRYTVTCDGASDTVTINIPGSPTPQEPKEEKGGFFDNIIKKFKSLFGSESPTGGSEENPEVPFTPTPQSPTGGSEVVPPTTPSGLSVDLKVNGSDGPTILLNRGDRLTTTWASAGAKRCTFAIMDPSGKYLTNGGVSVQSGIDVDYTHPFYPKEGEYRIFATCFDKFESDAESVQEEIRVSINPQSKPYLVMKVPRSVLGALGLSYTFDWVSAGGIQEVTVSLEGVSTGSSTPPTFVLGTVPDRGFYSWFVPTTVPSGTYRVVGTAIGTNGVQGVAKSEPFSIDNPNYQPSRTTPNPTPATSTSNPAPSPTPTNPQRPSTVTPTPTPTSTQTPTPAPSECITISQNLFFEVNAPTETRKLQRALIDTGYLKGVSVPTDSFGVSTESAVATFQKDNGIAPSGFVGELTRAKVKLVTCGEGGASNSASTPTIGASLPIPPVPTPAPLPVSKSCSLLTRDGRVALGEVEPSVIFIIPSGWTRDGQSIRTKEGTTIPVWPNVPTQVNRTSGGTAQEPRPGQYLFSDNTLRLADGSILRDFKAEGQPALRLEGGKTSDDVMRNADGTALRMGREHVLREAGIPLQMASMFYSRAYSPFSFEGVCAETGTRYDVSGGSPVVNPPTTPAFTPTEGAGLGNPPTLTVTTSPQCGGFYDISWTSVPGATGYRLYKNTPTNTEPPIYEGSGLSYTDGMVIAGHVQQYRIEAYNATSRTAKSGLTYVPPASGLCSGAPKPSIRFTATPSTLSSGMSTVISWETTNARFCRASLGTEDWSGVFGTYEYLNNTIPASGSKTVGPITIPSTMSGTMYSSFYIACFGNGGSDSATAWLVVTPGSASSKISSFANILEGFKGIFTP